jgi:hypothetical protein
MDLMYIRHKLGGDSPLAPDEEMVYSQERFRAISVFCAPFNQGLWLQALGFNATLRVTSRRVILSGHTPLLPFYRQEVDLWFPGRQPKENTDVITSVSIGDGRYGPYLEIKSQNPLRRKSWYASPNLRARVFCDNPQGIWRIVNEAISSNQSS